jgi:hypothetical protein
MSKVDRLDDLQHLAKIALASCILFVAMSIALQVLCEYVLSITSFRFSRIAHGQVATDILVIGNSRGVNLMSGTGANFKPRVFNLAYNGLGRHASIALVKQFFSSGNKARYVVFEASSLWVWGDIANCELKTYWDELPMLKSASARGCPDDVVAARFLPLTIYNTELFLRVAYYGFVHRYTDQDWVNSYSMTSSMCTRLLTVGESDDKPPDEKQIPAARADVAELRSWMTNNAHGAKLVFINASYFSSPPLAQIIREYDSMSDRILGAGTYLDLSRVLSDNCREFADSGHLSDSGRAAIRQRIFDYLRTAP